MLWTSFSDEEGEVSFHSSDGMFQCLVGPDANPLSVFLRVSTFYVLEDAPCFLEPVSDHCGSIK